MDDADDQGHAEDGLPVRSANAWARYKLDIVECYVPTFVRACQKAPTVQLVDAFAGFGLNRFADNGEVRRGTTLIALNADPGPTRVLAVDKGSQEVEALSRRCASFGQRAVVRRGDANRDLVPLMSEQLEPRAPTLSLFDPEGTELEFSTLEQVAAWKHGSTKTELLILLATHTGWTRMLSADPREWAVDKMDRLYGTKAWGEVHRRRHEGLISTDRATTEYVQLYCRQLEQRLGYAYTDAREIREGGRYGRLGYFLVFASDHPGGERIMRYCFDEEYGDEQQPTLFPARRSRLDE